MQAGPLRNYLTIQQNTLGAPDANGARAPSWTTLASGVAAEIKPLSGREMEFAKSFAATVTHRIRIRFDPSNTYTTQHRVAFNGRIFEINAVLNWEERNRELWLFCTEIISLPQGS